ncbi:hypothetical protein RHGRI_034371 [Rhododendron griersonianum]|uniref:PGG domain-containing protein n=1 Tax=Rhododendron griersonianum TaxID=479676 RepID=A0AAV6I6D8_9ERIC|nr:hypothetical protein RHGRI_034371 [Rhododendron griersonianum]
MAKRLIKYDRELIRVQGKERKTPLHCVAEAGDTDLLAEFLCACPESIKDLTIRDETALHIAVKERKVAAFRLIFEWIWRSYNGELLIWKDEKGNTVLHIAVSTNQHEAFALSHHSTATTTLATTPTTTPPPPPLPLLYNHFTTITINPPPLPLHHQSITTPPPPLPLPSLHHHHYYHAAATSTTISTPLPPLHHHHSIAATTITPQPPLPLHHHHHPPQYSITINQPPPQSPLHHYHNKHARSLDVFLQSSEPYFEKVLRFILYCRRELSLDMRNMVLVVAVLIATATFEARGSLVENESTKSPASASGSNVTSIGKVVGDLSYYSISTVSFTASIAVMISVLSLKPFTSFLHLSLVFLAISYGYKMVNISPWQTTFPISLIVLVYAFKLIIL